MVTARNDKNVDSEQLGFLTHGSSVERFGSHCNHTVTMENQDTLRENTAGRRSACTLDFGDPKEKNKRNGNDAFCWEF